jgi:hypothetical protein
MGFEYFGGGSLGKDRMFVSVNGVAAKTYEGFNVGIGVGETLSAHGKDWDARGGVTAGINVFQAARALLGGS